MTFEPERQLSIRVADESLASDAKGPLRVFDVLDKHGNTVGWLPVIGFSLDAPSREQVGTMTVSLHCDAFAARSHSS